MRLIRALEADVLIGDGANGTCLAARGFTRQPYDLANLLAPDLVRAVHLDYFEAGSQVVETNTFAASRVRLAEHNVNPRDVNIRGAQLAREAAGPDRLVLGSIGPVGKPMEPIGPITEAMVRESIQEQGLALAEGGVDGFILETYIDIAELEVAVRALHEVSDLPIIVSKAYIEDGEMLAQGLPTATTKAMNSFGVVAVGANCIVGPQRMIDLVRMIAETTELPILAYPTPGMPQLVKGVVTYDTQPEYFAKAAVRLVEEGARVIGGCCGTTPDHIRELSRLLNRTKIRVKPRPSVAQKTADLKPLPQSEPTELARKVGKKFVTAVEMDVPRGLNVDKLLSACKELKIAGADVINISDGARARLRINPMAVADLIQSRVGIEVTMHFSCRDRNLLAIQSDLLGCHAMGVRNILAVTGDPANIGDYPSATSVFDIDSIGLVRILSRFNEGIDMAGYSVGMRCAFTICCAFNPLSFDRDLELDRLKRKVDAGAHIVYTQPVFDEDVALTTAESCQKLGVPVFIGVLPLRSQRHCEFMHNEVPGITIPEWLRNRMAEAPDEASALQVGIEEAQKLSRRIKECAQGLYLMPPFGSANVAEQVMESVR
ncbi:MAG: bifunctional homocysteine S-methyltransferase/methylenetetrahydrofolate reductase [Fimbriimonadales bacterium]